MHPVLFKLPLSFHKCIAIRKVNPLLIYQNNLYQKYMITTIKVTEEPTNYVSTRQASFLTQRLSEGLLV